uniref:Macrophage mannose receptor 1-like n=1 Tax=Saccoglossus kowalevskii TaxID=10224 RepID=A0ABM0LV84_SACKO|nr:PREDICTED: macrophage mannose receptor 1-like [Saccoglossus kowalevskii]
MVYLAVTSQRCESNWLTYAQRCFLLEEADQPVTWYEATQACENKNAYLVVIESQEINSFLQELATMNYWIGLHDIGNEGTFTWIDGAILDNKAYTNWDSEQPNNLDSGVGEDCTEMQINGRWNDKSCDDTSTLDGYICQKAMDVPIRCDEDNGWMSVNDRCYKYKDTVKTWEDAKQCCEKMGADLVRVQNQIVQDYVTQLTTITSLWIGLSDNISDQKGEYSWANGSPISYTNWALDEPRNNSADNCVTAKLSKCGQWITASCATKLPFLCEKPEGSCAPGWKIYKGHCYQYQTQVSSSWINAKYTCDTQGAYLVTIDTKAEQNYLISEYSAERNNIWIGISDTRSDGEFAWSSGCPVSYTNWNEAHPLNMFGQEDCGTIFTGGYSGERKWREDGRCGHEYPYNGEPAECDPNHGKPCCSSNGLCGNTEDHCMCATCTDYTQIYDIDPTSPVQSVVDVHCDVAWDLHGDYCYLFETNKLAFHEAEAACEQMDAKLTSILNLSEQKFISGRIDNRRTPMWFGLHDRNHEMQWEWTSGDEYSFTNWADGEPNNYFQVEDCAHIIVDESRNGEWNDITCDTDLGYICKKRKYEGVFTAPPPQVRYQSTESTETISSNKTCPQCGTWTENEDHCYIIIKIEKNWPEAWFECTRYGGYLLTISSQEENDYIHSILKGDTGNLWIGLKKNILGVFEWIDNDNMPYSNWVAGEPNDNDGIEDCVEMYESGQWNDKDCYHRTGFMCKANKGLTNTSRGLSGGAIAGIVIGSLFVLFLLYVCKDKWWPKPCKSSNKNTPTATTVKPVVESVEFENNRANDPTIEISDTVALPL